MRTHCQTGRFTYRPHLLMADRTVEIGKHGFYLLRDGRRDYRIDYDEITALRAIYDEDRAEMMRLEDYFTKLAAEREAQLALERKKAEELARQQAQQVTLAKAAVMLQRCILADS